MTRLLTRWETRVALAGLRRVAIHPTRRGLWIVVAAVATAAFAFDVATSDVASRDLGAWSPDPAAVAAIGLVLFAVAAVAGRWTPLTYGTRTADVIWWRYAGVDTDSGRRATTAVLTLHATVLIALGAAPLALLFALAAPRHAITLVFLALSAIVLAPLTVLVSSATAPRDAADDVPASATGERVKVRPSQQSSRIPAGLFAARWLIARRRSESFVPYGTLAAGTAGGFIAPRFAGAAGGDLVAMAVVIGGFALLLDGALRRSTAPGTLLSPWWRSAIGTSGAAVVAWALADSARIALFGAGAALGLGIAFGSPLLAVAAVPVVFLVPVALRLTALAVDVLFPAALDRRAAGASVRVVAVATLTAVIVTLALAAAVRGGVFAALATVTLLLTGLVLAAARWCAFRLPGATN